MLSEAELKRGLVRIRKRETREKGLPEISQSIQQRICLLVIMGSPWACIQAVALVLNVRKQKRMISPGMTTKERLKDIAAKAAARWKEPIKFWLERHDSHEHVAAKSLWHRWSVALWLRVQNMKGLCIPSAAVIDRYVSLWGQGPHQENLTNHLNQFSKPFYRKKWLRDFRKGWGFSYPTLPARTTTSVAEIRRKVTCLFSKPKSGEMKTFISPACSKNGTTFGSQIWYHISASVFLVLFHVAQAKKIVQRFQEHRN